MRAATVLVAFGLLAGPLRAQAPDSARATVVYLSGGLAYLDVGREHGLVEGAEVRVVRGVAVLGTMVVRHLSSHRAACELGTLAGIVAVGDTVRFNPVRTADPAVAAAALRAERRQTSQARAQRTVRGRVGLRYQLVRGPDGAGYHQPGVDLRLDAMEIGGSPIGLVADVRARRTARWTPEGGTRYDARNGVYQLAAIVGTMTGPARLRIGRQYLPLLSSVSLFDGALAEWQAPRWGAGAFLGTEPEPVTMAFDQAIRHYGAFAQVRSSPGSRARWQVSAGGAASYAVQASAVNREFAFVQATVSTPGFNMFLSQELDVNRAWKADLGEPSVSPTSTLVTLGARPASWLSLGAGFDNRRNVRLYRDVENPETAFDDSFRQGYWGSMHVRAARRIRLGLDGRVTAGGADSTSRTRSVTGSLAIDQLTSVGFGLRARVTSYTGGRGQGWLGSGEVSIRPVQRLGVAFTAGRREDRALATGLLRGARWIGADVDLGLGRAFYLLATASRETGALAAGDHLLVSLSYRF